MQTSSNLIEDLTSTLMSVYSRSLNADGATALLVKTTIPILSRHACIIAPSTDENLVLQVKELEAITKSRLTAIPVLAEIGLEVIIYGVTEAQRNIIETLDPDSICGIKKTGIINQGVHFINERDNYLRSLFYKHFGKGGAVHNECLKLLPTAA